MNASCWVQAMSLVDFTSEFLFRNTYESFWNILTMFLLAFYANI